MPQDEIGIVVRHGTDDGFLQPDALGKWDLRVLRAHREDVRATIDPLTAFLEGETGEHDYTL